MQCGNEKECFDYLDQINKRVFKGSVGCNGTFDSVLCFEATPANHTLELQCPEWLGVFDVTKTLLKTCLSNGVWEGYNKTGTHAGHTDYDQCLNENSLKQAEFEKSVYYHGVLKIVLYEEIFGISLSILCLLFSLSIFICHKSLRCKRTKIHLNLFVAILGQSIFRLLFHLDGVLYDPEKKFSYSLWSLQFSLKICPIGTAFIEYFAQCSFMWMLCEGIYLNVLLTYSIFDHSQKKFIVAFYFIGWVLPAITVSSWFITMYKTNGFDEVCWYGYFYEKPYWMIRGPTLAALVINIFCLCNVIRILKIKLRENQSNDSVNQIKKSFKAAALLLPLLGVTHLFEMYHGAPSHWLLFLIFKITTCFLVFFNGVFLSILYCFMNNEVKNVLKRHWLRKFYENKILADREMSRTERQSQGIEFQQVGNFIKQDSEQNKALLNTTNTEMINLITGAFKMKSFSVA